MDSIEAKIRHTLKSRFDLDEDFPWDRHRRIDTVLLFNNIDQFEEFKEAIEEEFDVVLNDEELNEQTLISDLIETLEECEMLEI